MRRSCSMALVGTALVACALSGDGPAWAQSAAPGPLLIDGRSAVSGKGPGPRSAGDLLVVDVRDGELDFPVFASEPETAPRATPAPIALAAAGSIPRVGSADVDQIVVEASARYRVDPDLVRCVMFQESGGRPYAISPRGASGYMQLMPATARRFGVTDIFDARQNIHAGVYYLKLLLTMFDNNVPLALAGYNAGEYAVIRSGYRIPRLRETENYVRAIIARYGRLRHEYPGDAVPRPRSSAMGGLPDQEERSHTP